MIVTKKAIPRRTVLRGLGVTIALPLLDSMVPAAKALAQTPAAPLSAVWIRLRAAWLDHARVDTRSKRARTSSSRKSCGRSNRSGKT